MAVTISRLSVILSGSASGFESLMHGAEGTMHGFEHTVEHSSHHVGELLAAMGLGLSLEGIAEYLKGTFEAVISTEKLSIATGIATQTIGELHYAASLAGVASEDMDTGIRKMLRSLYEAENGSKEAAAAFQRLGLDSHELINAKPDEAFERVAEAMRKVGNAGELAGVGAAVFGKNYATIIPLLRMSREEFEESKAQADALHVAMGSIDVAQVELAHKGIAQLEGALQGAANVLVVKLSPYITGVTHQLFDMAKTGDGVSGLVTNGFEMLTEGIAASADYLKVLDAGWQTMRGVAAYAIGSVVDGIGTVISGVEWLSNKLTGTSSHFGESMSAVGTAMIGVGEDAFKKAGEDWDAFMSRTNSKSVHNLFHDLEASSRNAATAIANDANNMGRAMDEIGDGETKKATDALAQLQKQVEEFGKTRGQKAAMDVAAAGGTPEQQAQARALGDTLDGMEAVKKAQDEMAQDAKRLWEETRTPAQKYADQLDKINVLLAEGKINQETADAARQKADDDLAKGLDDKTDTKAEAPKLLEAGSQDVVKFAADVQARQRAEEHQQQALALAKNQVDHLKAIRDAVTTPPAPDDTESIFNA